MTSNKPEPFTLLLGFQIKNRSLQFDNFCPCLSPCLSYTLDTHLLSCLFFQGKVSQKKQMIESKRDSSVGLLCVFQRLPRGCTVIVHDFMGIKYIIVNVLLVCLHIFMYVNLNLCMTLSTGLFISPSGISELDCATTKTDTAERSISIGRESLQVFFCTRGLGVLTGSTARG